jgi:hypothetical protein
MNIVAKSFIREKYANVYIVGLQGKTNNNTALVHLKSHVLYNLYFNISPRTV